MSVYIKGMEMPKMPDNIGQGEKIPYIDVRIFADGEAAVSKDTRPYYDKYVVVELPPHGRLIDADALLSQYKGNIWTAQTDYAEGLRDVANDIKQAPAIIEAEEDE